MDYFKRVDFPLDRFNELLFKELNIKQAIITTSGDGGEWSNSYDLRYLINYEESLVYSQNKRDCFLHHKGKSYPILSIEAIYNSFGRYGNVVNQLDITEQLLFLHEYTNFISRYQLLRPETYIAECIYTTMYENPDMFVYSSGYKQFVVMLRDNYLKEFALILKKYKESPEKAETILKTCEEYHEIKKLTLTAELSLM